jgi:hypothetical protein
VRAPAAIILTLAALVAHGSGGGIGSALPKLLPRSRGATFYVALSGSDRNRGTRRHPWRTIQHALDRLRPGQRAFVLSGTYAEDLAMRRSGTPSRPITLAARGRVVIHPASTSGNTYGIEITGSYFRLRGFVIEGSLGDSSADVYVEDRASHVEIFGNEIRYGQDQGIFADPGTSYVHILSNRIHDNGWHHRSGQHQSHGIYIEGGRDLIANNVIYNHPYGFGIQIYPDNHDTVVVDNTITTSGHSGIVVGGDGGVSGIVIRNNIVAFNRSWGIEHDSDCPTAGVVVDHNLFTGNGDGGVNSGCSAIDSSGGNIGGNPRFRSMGGHDFRLGKGSPAIAHAIRAYSLPTDRVGRSRGGRRLPDVGAYER